MGHAPLTTEIDQGKLWSRSKDKGTVDRFSNLLIQNGIPVIRRLTINGYQVAITPVPELKRPPLTEKTSKKSR